jgi:hypothetical protein
VSTLYSETCLTISIYRARPRNLNFAERFRTKDIAQLYYSAPAGYFSNTDRLRFYPAYAGCDKLTGEHKAFIRRVIAKTKSMARHGQKHGIPAPFAR